MKKERWFWFWIGTITVPKTLSHNRIKGEFWNNLILICSHSVEDAIRKADKEGRARQGDTRGSLRLNGRLAVCYYIGITDFGLVDGDIEDGVEILFKSNSITLASAKELALPSETINCRMEELQQIIERQTQR